jgi:hypothetical protein
MKTIKYILFLLSISSQVYGNDEILKSFEVQAGKQFSATEGEKIYRNKRVNSKGETISCMTCHTPNPKAEGLTRANKIIDPLAPVANKERFTDMVKVEKWFKRNCKDVLDRECTVMEKGNFVKFMMSVK